MQINCVGVHFPPPKLHAKRARKYVNEVSSASLIINIPKKDPILVLLLLIGMSNIMMYTSHNYTFTVLLVYRLTDNSTAVLFNLELVVDTP